MSTHSASSHHELIHKLSQQIRMLEGSSSMERQHGAHFQRAGHDERDTGTLETCPTADEDIGCQTLLPWLQPEPGSMVEWLSERPGSGATTLAMFMAREAMKEGGALVVVDQRGTFYPPAAARLGIDLNRVILVRPETKKQGLWALEQALRCPGVAAALCPMDQMDQRTCCVLRRLQLAAEQGGAVALLHRPVRVRHQPSWATKRLLVQPLAAEPVISQALSNSATWPSRRRIRIEQLHCRGILELERQTVELELCYETGDVRLAPELPHSTVAVRTSGA